MDNHTASVVILPSTLATQMGITAEITAKESLSSPTVTFTARYFLIALLSVLTIAIKIELKRKSKKGIFTLPPGPAGIPILGYVPFIGAKAHETFAQLATVYGSIFKIKLGFQSVVIITDYKLIREALKSKSFTERPVLRMLSKVIQDYGLVNVNGDKWRDQRQFVMRAMREMGLARTGPNRNKAEEKIVSVIDDMINIMKNNGKAPLDLSPEISECVGRILMKTLWNFDMPIGDTGLRKNIERAEAGFKTSLTNLVNYFPILTLTSGVKKDMEFIKQSHKETHQFFKELVEKHRNSSADENDESGNMIAWFQQRMDENKNYYDESQLLSILAELFSAGLETTKTTLLWMLLYVTRDIDIQNKIHEELDNNIGPNRRPTLDDVANLPYTNACIMETQRFASITPSGLMHVANEDSTIGGYYIPKGTEIMGHQWTLHHNPDLWKSPHEFNPNNFLDENDNLIKPPYFIPFSTGRRMCLGHELAAKDLFLIFSSLMHSFTFTFENNIQPSIEPVIGFTLTPQNFKVIATPRNFS